MLNKLINLLFAVAICFALGLAVFGLSGAHAADYSKAMFNLRQSAVMINGLACTGSGSVVQGKSGKHYILTNAHVCNCAKYMGGIAATFEGGELLRAHVTLQDWSHDLCAAQLEADKPALLIGQTVSPFTEVNTRGYPGGRLTESHGMINGTVDWEADFPIEEIGSCPLNSRRIYGLNDNLAACRMHFSSTLTTLFSRPGSSGSAVVNDEGQLVGVISSFHPGNEFDSGMVSFSDVRRFLEGL